MNITGGSAADLDRSQARLARPPAPPADPAALWRWA
jgi:hypothetical protein